MTHQTNQQTVVNLRHRTYPRVAFVVANAALFRSRKSSPHYDAGANFLGSLGQKNNHQLGDRKAELVCTWTGNVSIPLPPAASNVHTADVLFDFNGSGIHFQNNDPRYFLPNGSKGLILNRIEFDSDVAMLEGWCAFKGGFVEKLYSLSWLPEWVKSMLLEKAQQEVRRLNERCTKGEVLLKVHF